MGNINVYDILSYGVIGLGFLLAFLAYRLLTREQKRDGPRPAILKAIYVFMTFSIILCVVGFASEFVREPAQAQAVRDLQEQLSAARQKNREYDKQLAVVKESIDRLLDAKGGIVANLEPLNPLRIAIESVDKQVKEAIK